MRFPVAKRQGWTVSIACGLRCNRAATANKILQSFWLDLDLLLSMKVRIGDDIVAPHTDVPIPTDFHATPCDQKSPWHLTIPADKRFFVAKASQMCQGVSISRACLPRLISRRDISMASYGKLEYLIHTTVSVHHNKAKRPASRSSTQRPTSFPM